MLLLLNFNCIFKSIAKLLEKANVYRVFHQIENIFFKKNTKMRLLPLSSHYKQYCFHTAEDVTLADFYFTFLVQYKIDKICPWQCIFLFVPFLKLIHVKFGRELPDDAAIIRY